jgi:hypothetical protein
MGCCVSALAWHRVASASAWLAVPHAAHDRATAWSVPHAPEKGIHHHAPQSSPLPRTVLFLVDRSDMGASVLRQ